MTRLHVRLATAGAAALAVLAGGTLTAPAQAAPRAPIVSSWANPGVVEVPGAGFAMLRTAAWDKKGASRTAPTPRGPWKSTGKRLLTSAPAWANTSKRGVWAPSVVQGGDGRWFVYYSALIRGSAHSRCIGTGIATNPTGPFTPAKRPIACWNKKTKPQDLVPNERSTSIIDATPAKVGGYTVLTFKTEHRYRKSGKTMWQTSIRMLNLDPQSPNRAIANPVNKKVRSVLLTRKRHRYIEENPSLVQRGTTFTLFTSWGWYGTTNYVMQYRQNPRLWTGWNTRKVTRLSFPKGTNTQGRGNGQALGDSQGRWFFFWNGHRPNFKRGEGPKYLYVGRLGWTGAGAPYVQKVLKRA